MSPGPLRATHLELLERPPESNTITWAFQVGGALLLVACIMPLFIIALCPIAVGLFYLQRFYTHAARDIKGNHLDTPEDF